MRPLAGPPVGASIFLVWGVSVRPSARLLITRWLRRRHLRQRNKQKENQVACLFFVADRGGAEGEGGGRGNIQHAARTQQQKKEEEEKGGLFPVIGKGITCLMWF